MAYDPQLEPTSGIVDTAGLAYLVSVQSQLPLAMYIVNQTTGSTYTTEKVAGVMTVVQTGGPGTVVVPPASPQYFVSNAGSDAITQPGTQALPLLTVQEACRRLAASGWTGSPIVTTLDLINFGASPSWAVPPPVGAAFPITFRTTTQVDLSNIAPTGGTQGSFAVPVTPSTVTTGIAMVANAHRGKILSFTAGPGGLSGTWHIIHANDAAGVFSLPERTIAAPVAGNLFDVLSRLGRWTWTGNMQVTHPGGMILDGMQMEPTGAGSEFTSFGGPLQENATRWVPASTFSIEGRNTNWMGALVSLRCSTIRSTLRQD